MNSALNKGACTRLTAIALAAVLAFVSSWAQAQAFPSRPITLVVPFPAGSTSDVLARILSEELKGPLGVPVVVENRAGASGAIGAALVAKAPADGHMLTVTSAATHSVNPWTIKKLNYDPINDFTHVTRLVQAPLVVLVNPTLPIQSMADLVKQARDNPGKMAFGYGTQTHHVSALAIAHRNKLEVLAVPYKGTSAAVLAAATGEVQFVLADVISSAPLLKAGKLRAIAASQTFAAMPNVPVLTEIGYPDFTTTIWVGLAGPANMPKDVTARLSDEVGKILRRPEIKDKIAHMGLEASPSAPAEFDRYVRNQLSSWGERIRAAGITPE